MATTQLKGMKFSGEGRKKGAPRPSTKAKARVKKKSAPVKQPAKKVDRPFKNLSGGGAKKKSNADKLSKFVKRQPKALSNDVTGGAKLLLASAFKTGTSAKGKRITGGSVAPIKVKAMGPDVSGVVNTKEVAKGGAKRILQASTAPSSAIAGGTLAAVKGDNIVKGAKEGVKNSTSFSNVLEEMGVDNKYIRAVAGFGLDVLADPTTYVTLGTGVPAEVQVKIATRAAAVTATEKALKKGLSKKAADKAGRAAAAKTREKFAKLPQNKGVQVGVRVHVPFTDKTFEKATSGKTTAKISEAIGASKAATKIRESEAGQGMGKALLHDFRPSNRTPEQHAKIRSAERRQRAREGADAQRVDRRVTALEKASKGRHEKIVDDIENARDTQPDKVVETLKGDFKEMFDAEKKRGLRETPYRPADADDAQDYFPHTRTDKLKGKGPDKGKRRQIQPEAPEQRGIRGKIDEINADPELPEFSKHVPAVYAEKAHKTASNARKADFWDEIAKTGRKVTPGDSIDLAPTESVYRITPRGLERLNHKSKEGQKALARVKSGKTQGKHAIFDDEVIDSIVGKLSNNLGAADRPYPIKKFDQIQGTWKMIVTQPMPSYHIRNLFGDSMNAFVGDATTKSFAQSTRILKARAKRNKAERSPEQFTDGSVDVDDLDKTIKIRGKEYTYREILDEAETEGVIGGGFLGRREELFLDDGAQRTLGRSSKFKKEPKVKKRSGGALNRAAQYREDAPRLATYLSARKRGMTPAEAAEHTLTHHFDYGDVTNFEVGARRVIPFWTFFARNTRLHATKILQRPGKYATFGKFMNEAAKLAGYEDYDEFWDKLRDYEQRGLPIPIKIAGQTYQVQVAPPITDLNQITADPKTQLQNIANRVSFVKAIPEVLLNYSIFFQGPIESDHSPRVRAPEIVGDLPPAIRRKLGVKKIRDRESGKRVWGWPRRVDYVMRQTPETNLAVQLMTKGTGSRNQKSKEALIGAATGAKVTKFDEKSRRVERAFEKLGEVDREIGSLSQQGRKGSAADRRAKKRQKKLQAQINRLQRQMGYKDPNFPQHAGGTSLAGFGGDDLAGGL